VRELDAVQKYYVLLNLFHSNAADSIDQILYSSHGCLRDHDINDASLNKVPSTDSPLDAPGSSESGAVTVKVAGFIH